MHSFLLPKAYVMHIEAGGRTQALEVTYLRIQTRCKHVNTPTPCSRYLLGEVSLTKPALQLNVSLSTESMELHSFEQ